MRIEGALKMLDEIHRNKYFIPDASDRAFLENSSFCIQYTKEPFSEADYKRLTEIYAKSLEA